MNTETTTTDLTEMTPKYKPLPYIYRRNSEGVITKTIYPMFYQIEKAKHYAEYIDVMKDITKYALMMRFKNGDMKCIARHIYERYYNDYNFNNEDLTIHQEPRMFGEPYTYVAVINNENWNVSYYIEINRYGDQLKKRLTEYIKENIYCFNPHSIWIHLEDHKDILFEKEQREASSFEDTDTKCPICLEEYCDEKECDKLHNCGHKYCVDCIDQVIEYGSCSICRETTDIEETGYETTEDDIRNWCEEGNDEMLWALLTDADEVENFVSYCADSDGYCHTLGFETECDMVDDNGDECLLMCRLDAYEKKTNNIPYTYN